MIKYLEERRDENKEGGNLGLPDSRSSKNSTMVIKTGKHWLSEDEVTENGTAEAHEHGRKPTGEWMLSGKDTRAYHGKVAKNLKGNPSKNEFEPISPTNTTSEIIYANIFLNRRERHRYVQ